MPETASRDPGRRTRALVGDAADGEPGAGVAAVRDLRDSEAKALGRRVPSSGIKVKTPGAARDTMPVNFASRCSDDLTRYLMAGARDARGPLADLADSLDLAVRRLRRLAVETVRQRRLPFLLCGDMAADRAELEALLAAGKTASGAARRTQLGEAVDRPLR